MRYLKQALNLIRHMMAVTNIIVIGSYYIASFIASIVIAPYHIVMFMGRFKWLSANTGTMWSKMWKKYQFRIRGAMIMSTEYGKTKYLVQPTKYWDMNSIHF